MKKISMLLIVGTIALISCKKENIETIYYISIDTNELSFDSDGGKEIVTVTSKADWKLSGDSYWCCASAYSGDGDAEIIFTANPNEDSESGRTATFNFVSGDKKATLTVTQEKKEYSISIEPTELTFGAEGGERTINVKSSHKWILTNDTDWIKTSINEGESGSSVVIFVDHSTSSDLRHGEIIFTCGDETDILKVTQESVASQVIQFSNPDLKNIIISIADANKDEEISMIEAESVIELDLSGIKLMDLSDIQHFTNLTKLICSNTGIDHLDLSKNTALTYLDCQYNNITSLDLSKNTALTYLICSSTQLSALDISNNIALSYLSCHSTPLRILDLSKNTALTYLHCAYTNISSLDVSNNVQLNSLDCYNTAISSLDLSNNIALTSLACFHTPLSSLNVRNNAALTALLCDSTQLSFLDVSNNTCLNELLCGSNSLTSLDLHNNHELKILHCSNNPLEKLILFEHNSIDSSWMEEIISEYGDIIEYSE